MILFFTGTGNSGYIAEKLSHMTGEPLFSLNAAIKDGIKETVCSGDRLILVAPTYAWRIPHIVRDWLLHAELAGAKRIWFVMDCGGEIGNAAKYNLQLASLLNLRYMGTAQVVMPENYIAMFSVPDEAKARDIIERAQPDIEKAAEAIANDREFALPRCNLYDRLMSGPVNTLFYSLFVKAGAFSAGSACTGCGKCEKLCPLNNIHIADGKPVWEKNCTHCMACISYCPTEAIEYGRHSVGKRRYRIGDVQEDI